MLENSPYKKILHNGLKKSLSTLNAHVVPVIVCYGLGNFSINRCAQYQLAALLTMKSLYNSQVLIYDPVFYDKEIEILTSLELKMIDNNEIGKRKCGDKLTLFYMPHCFKGLVANVIYANWGIELNNCILLTNSFSEIVDDVVQDNQEIKDSVELIKKINPFTTEFILEDNFDSAPDAFHCTSLHVFSKEKLGEVPDDFWAPLTAPPFNQNDIDHERRTD